MLESYEIKYRQDLERVIAFWLKHSLDREYGGYFTCLERDGTVYDTKKYLWLQGREIWMFSRLYNEWERKQEYLDAASLGLQFMRRHAKDPQGRLYFSLTRDGKPYHYQRRPYSAEFYMIALLEYYKATGRQDCLEEAVTLYWRIRDWVADPTLVGRIPSTGLPRTSALGNLMGMATLTLELIAVDNDPRYRQVIEETLEGLLPHYDQERGLLRENIALPGSSIADWPEGRFFNPGHSIECGWFMLHMLEHVPSAKHRQIALDVIERSLEVGWDQEYGGITYFMDLEGKPTLQLESSMKLWWPITEALYALVLAYTQTGEERWLKWLERVDRYAYEHFCDPVYGEWYGYCDRQGRLTHTCKGGNYKGCFHVPRALLYSIQRIAKANSGPTV
jgi:N-acylglucosamine 2-epimerase